MKEALAALESAQLDLRHTTVSAPAEGVVTKTSLIGKLCGVLTHPLSVDILGRPVAGSTLP